MNPRRILVTGAASGIGRATALAFRAQGDQVVGLDRADPGNAADDWIAADLSDIPGIADLPLQGRFDALVNCAGLPPRAGIEPDILSVNFFALRALTRRVVPMLRPGSAIVSMASKAGARWRDNANQVKRLLALPDTAVSADFATRENLDPVRAYDLSKEAVIAWTKAITAELLDLDLRANTVSPAAVDTPILDDFKAAFGTRAERGIALTRRAGTADEVAAVIVFLAASESRWLRGSNIEVDGGLTAQLEAEALGLTSVRLSPGLTPSDG